MKHREGFLLVTVLMVFAVFSILFTVMLNVVSTENKQAILARNKIQAYYVARSGIEVTEAAILKLKDNETKNFDQKLDSLSGEVVVELIYKTDGDLTVDLSKPVVTLTRVDIDSLEIKSIGQVANSNETLTKIMKKDDANKYSLGYYKK